MQLDVQPIRTCVFSLSLLVFVCVYHKVGSNGKPIEQKSINYAEKSGRRNGSRLESVGQETSYRITINAH